MYIYIYPSMDTLIELPTIPILHVNAFLHGKKIINCFSLSLCY